MWGPPIDLSLFQSESFYFFQVLALFLLVANSLALPRNSNSFFNAERRRLGRHDISGGHYDTNAPFDRSYQFGYKADDHSREEQSDKDGLVMGKYSYVDSNGVQRSLSYRAGANIGFVPNLNDFSGHGNKKMKYALPTHLLTKF